MPRGWRIAEPPGSNSAASRPSSEPDDDGQPVFAPEDPRRSLDDLIIPGEVRSRIESALSLIQHHEQLFIKWNLAKINPYHRGVAINLYGPSGTGKSLCAEAIAHHIGRPFINVNYAQIESRYVGQTPKNIESAFNAAREHDAVLIFDEADAMLGSRLSHVTQSADHAVNVSRTTMLRQLDRFDGLVVFTTNFPENYDAAFVRRILTHIQFELPDLATRRLLWSYMLPAELPIADDVDLAVLAQESEGLAGGDLVNVIVVAATTAVRRPVEHRLVRLEDLQSEIRSTRRARSEVGKPPEGAQLFSWRTAPTEPKPVAPTEPQPVAPTEPQPVA
jgi:SpoVK/Ycf46/Vps4 family AAA+-type ATPase